MKSLLLSLCLLFALTSASYAVGTPMNENQLVGKYRADLHPEVQNLTISDFLTMTPKDYRRLTGKRLGIKNSIKLKVAQRTFKKKMGGNADISPGLYVVMAIFGLGWLAMGLIDDWEGDDWIINLVLTILCWLPGLIHALVKREDYY